MSKPNLVYILADDMGYGDLSCLNPDGKIRTPHLDAMAGKGMRFTDAHSSSAVCTPSRYSILTGRYNWRSSLKRGVLHGYDANLIETGRMTVASLCKQAGYATGCVGKWHLGWNWATNSDDPKDIDLTRPITNGPRDFGFDYFFGIVASLDMPPYVYVENDLPTCSTVHETPGAEGKVYYRPGPMAEDFELEDVLPTFTRRACGFITEQAAAGRPFLLYFPLPAPHTPILPTKPFRGASGTNEYGDFCVMVDDCVGQVAAALEAAGVADNTILIFAADNGCSPMADYPELAQVGHNPSCVFRGHKADIYEGGHRIPLLVQWPARIPANAVGDETVCLCDLIATIADVLGVDLPDSAGEDSVSNLPVWTGAELTGPLREATVHHSINGSFSIRQGRWKLEFCPGSGGWSEPTPRQCEQHPEWPAIQLYDLHADIAERTNVQAEHPDVVEALTALMTQYVRRGRSTPGTPQPNTGPTYWPQLNWMLEDEA